MRDREARNRRVLVVDDDVEQLEMVSRYLRLEGFQVATASESIGVSNLVRSFDPHLVLLDVEIPALSGDRLLVLLRKHARRETKFVLFSAWDEEKLRSLAMRVEAHGYISKSTDRAQLGRRLRAFMARGDEP